MLELWFIIAQYNLAMLQYCPHAVLTSSIFYFLSSEDTFPITWSDRRN